MEPARKTIEIPDEPEKQDGDGILAVAFAGRGDDDLRDTTKPVMKDAKGRLLYAPRGITFTFGR